MDACPTCGARYRGGEVCRRCGTQLGAVLAIEADGRRQVAAARAALRARDGVRAWRHAVRACAAHRTPAALRVLGLAALATRRYATALGVQRALGA